MDTCPICGLKPATITLTPGSQRVSISCARCGDFILVGQAFDLPAQWRAGKHPDRKPRGRFAATHAIRRMQANSGAIPQIDEALLRLLWAEPIPNPQRQAELLVLAIGDAGLPMDEYLAWRVERFCAEMGTEDDSALGKNGSFNLIRKRLIDTHLIESNQHPKAPNVELRLTLEGWAEYERLRHAVVESKSAFMAMGYGNTELANIVADHFVPAVRDTGFELYRLDDRPKPGIIDNRMRVEIRAAKFLVCDLTDENRGAYWEADFAEGAGKPVFYSCEKSKFDATRTHFDTEHLQTIKWDAGDPASAAEELQNMIRNTFPAESIPPDLSKRKGGS
jgi:hypothetical protein